MKKTKRLFVFESNYIKSNFFNFIFLFAVVLIANGFFINRVSADTTSTFYVTSGVDTTDGVITSLTTTGGQTSDIYKLSISDDNRMASNGAWPGGGVYDENKYIEFNFNPNLPSNSNILNVNLNFEYYISLAMNGAKIELYKNGAWFDVPIQLPSSTGTGGEILLDIDLSQYIQNVSDLNNLKIRFLAYRNNQAVTAKTSHDFVSLNVTYSENITPPPTTDFTEITQNIDTDTTWDLAGSPYVLNDVIAVIGGAKLTISPGVIVKFGEYGGLSVVENGSLIAVGNSEQKIYFTSLKDDIGGDTNGDSNTTTPASMDWDLLYLGENSINNLNNVVLRYSSSAMIDSSVTNISNFNSLDSIMFYDSSGILNNLNTNSLDFYNSDFEINNSNISSGDTISLSIYNSNIEINNSSVHNNFIYGNVITIDNSHAYFDNTNISGHNFINDGISVISNSTLNFINGDILNVFQGVGVYEDSSVNILNSNIGCSGGCVVLYLDGSVSINNSKIYGGDEGGIIYFGGPNTNSSILLTKNEIFNNQTGIASYQGDITGSMNYIHDNNVGAFSVDDIKIVNLINNYWGHETGPNHISNQNGLGDSVSDFVLFEPWLTYNPLLDQVSNVMFIPGFQGSRLYRQKESPVLGFYEDRIWEPSGNSEVDEMFMDQYGNSINDNIYTKDIIDEGNFWGLNTFNIYKSFIDSMDNLKTAGVVNDWSAIPYDWRFSPEDLVNRGVLVGSDGISYNYDLGYFDESYIINKLNQLANTSKTEKVTIITHSNGGLVARALILKLQEMKDNNQNNLIDKIDKIIFVASPTLGTPKAIPALLHGYEQDVAYDVLMNNKKARELGKNLPGAYNLIPSLKYLENGSPVITFDQSLDLIENWRSIYGDSIDNITELNNFLVDFGDNRPESSYGDIAYPLTLNNFILNKSKNFHSNVDNLEIPESIDVYEIVGFGLPTVKSINYGAKRSCNFLVNIFCKNKFEIDVDASITTEGDKTVVNESSFVNDGSRYYLNLNEYNKINLDKSHANIFEMYNLFLLIKNILNNDNSLPEYVTTEKPENPTYRVIKIHSPLSIDAYDNNDLHTGKLNSGNDNFDLIKEEIPNSFYFEIGETKYLILPNDGDFVLRLKGLDDGIFTIEQQKISGNDILDSIKFSEVPVSVNLIGEFYLSNNELASQIYLDKDNDQVFEEILNPSEPLPYIIEDNKPSLSRTFGYLPISKKENEVIPVFENIKLEENISPKNIGKSLDIKFDNEEIGYTISTNYNQDLFENCLRASVGDSIVDNDKLKIQILIVISVLLLLFSIKFIFKV